MGEEGSNHFSVVESLMPGRSVGRLVGTFGGLALVSPSGFRAFTFRSRAGLLGSS